MYNGLIYWWLALDLKDDKNPSNIRTIRRDVSIRLNLESQMDSKITQKWKK